MHGPHISDLNRPRPHGTSLEVIERAAGMLRAAGDPERMRILEMLLAGEQQVGDIAAATEAELSTTSQRLSVLHKEHLVVRRRDGRRRYYSLADDHVRTLVTNILDHADPGISIKP